MSDPSTTSSSEPEFLGSEPLVAPRRPRQRVVLAGAVLGVAAVGMGGWGLAQLMSSGDDPATAVPGIAVGYLAVDLDPSASQKIEALRMLKKFPAIDAELDLGVRDDVRRWIFEQVQEQADCPVDYEQDVEPWLGDRFAVAAVPDDDAPLAPLVVVQVSDPDAARDGFAALEECAAAEDETLGGPTAENGPAGVAFVGDYMLVAESQADADSMAKAAEAAPLADDPAFSDWMQELGDPGVVTAYASRDLPRLSTEAAKELGRDLSGPDGTPPGGGLALDPFAGTLEPARALWKDFDGMAGVLRFADGSMEAEVVARGLPDEMAPASRTGPSLADLPESTAAAFTVSLPDGWLDGYLEALNGVLGAGESEDDFWAGMEAGTGLQLPEDIAALLGDGVSLSLDASADLKGLMGSPEVPQLPVAVRIAGDTAEIRRVLDRLLALVGPAAEGVALETGEGVVVVGLDQAYVDRVLAGGRLGESGSFRAVVPEAERAGAALFVNFDAGDGWLERLTAEDEEARSNVAPLDALGVSGWTDGDVQHGLLRLRTD